MKNKTKILPTFADGDKVRLCNLLQSDNIPDGSFMSTEFLSEARREYLGKIGVLEKSVIYNKKDTSDWFDFAVVSNNRYSKFLVHISEIKHVQLTDTKEEYPQSNRKNNTAVTEWLEQNV